MTETSAPALDYRDVSVTYPNGMRAACGVNLTVEAGECLALVGESGCGKTTLARAALGLLPRGTHVNGSIRLAGEQIVGASPATLRRARGLVAGFVAQDPFAACNPLDRVRAHVAEAWRAHELAPPPGAVVASLEALGIADAARSADLYPHQWSGGMLQRAVIAAAAAHRPPLLIADEPTSALDAERRDAVLGALKETRAGLLLISHDLRAVAAHADKIAVCRAGRVVESGPAAAVLNRPQHPYTKELLNASAEEVTPMRPAPGALDSPERSVVLEARDLSCAYRHGGELLRAVVRADLRVCAGEIVGIHGPSGCGKSTLLRLLATVEYPTTGRVTLSGALATRAGSARLFNPLARRGFVMPIFQDPVGSLDRRWPVWRTITEPLAARHRRGGRPARPALRALARQKLDEVGLQDIDPEARPGELSAGQCQRVSIARALAAAPALIVADEPTSALDVITAANILRLLAEAARKGTAVVIVSHDQSLLRRLCHRVLTMRDGVLEAENR